MPLTQDMIGRLAVEAAFRDVSMGELLSEIIVAVINKDLCKHARAQVLIQAYSDARGLVGPAGGASRAFASRWLAEWIGQHRLAAYSSAPA